MTRLRHPMLTHLSLLVVFCLFYTVVVFPFAYFRHDDWMMLGNALSLDQDWSRLWSAHLLHAQGDLPWFFRPFFLLGNWLCYHLFGFRYALWLSVTLLFTAGAAFFATRAIAELTGGRASERLFLLLFTLSLPLHFGNLVWVGEGLMNCPLVFFLAMSTWLFAKASRETSRRWLALSVVTYLLALGFKESAIFHTAFLFGLVLDKPFATLSWRQRITLLTPFAIVTAIYLGFRFLALPINGDYLPHWNWINVLRPLAYFAFFLSLPAIAWYLAAGKNRSLLLTHLHQKRVYLPFLAVSILPHLSHPFLSPGWLLYPGLFTCLILAISAAPSLAPRWERHLAPILLALSLIPVGYEIHRLQWWKWHVPQKRFHEMVRNANPAVVKQFWIYNCTMDSKETGFERVVGHTTSIFHLWKIHHPGYSIATGILPCYYHDRQLALVEEGMYLAKWDFPRIGWSTQAP